MENLISFNLYNGKFIQPERVNESNTDKIIFDSESMTVTLHTDDGDVTIGVLYDEANNAKPIKGELSISANSKSPLGFVTVKIEDLKKLLNKANEEFESEIGKI